MKLRKTAVYSAMTMIASVFFALVVFAQEDVTVVEDSAFQDKTRPPVPFLHDTHNEAAEIDECNVCHHVYEDGKRLEYETSEDMECSECHTLAADDNPIALINIYHLNCKGCHQKKKAGPVMCSECHVK
jgi:hypothetical protein